jgi:hypothetical protein
LLPQVDPADVQRKLDSIQVPQIEMPSIDIPAPRL